MTTSQHAAGDRAPKSRFGIRSPLLIILQTRQHTRLVITWGVAALLGAVVTNMFFEWQVWKSVALVLVVLAGPAIIKWRADAGRFGVGAAVAGSLVTVQGLHSIEHLAQWSQRHILGLPLRNSNGLLSPANTEWVHFVWNWLVLAAIVFLMFKGMRGFWGWAILVWAFAHTFEHSYMMWRYLQISGELEAYGVDVTAQGLPGIVGAGGWLDLNAGPRLQLICGLPFVTTTDRVDAHFIWNAGEILLLLPAVSRYLRTKVPAFAAQAEPAASSRLLSSSGRRRSPQTETP